MRSLLLSIALVAMGCSSAKDTVLSESVPEPTIVIVSPAHKSLIDESSVEVIVLTTGLSDVTINGSTTNEIEGEHTAAFYLEPGVHTFVAEGIDEGGDAHIIHSTIIGGEFADGNDQVDQGLRLRLNQDGLDHTMQVASNMVIDDDFEASIKKMNPIYEDRYELLGFEVYEYEALVTRLVFDTLELEANPRTGVLGFNAIIPDLEIDVLVQGEVSYFDFDTETWFWADQALIQGDIYLTVDDGDLSVEISDPSINFVGFGYDLGALPGDIVEGLFAETIEETIEEILLEQVVATLPDMIDETLSSLDLSFETELMGANINATALFAQTSIDSEGIEMAFDIDIEVAGEQIKPYDIFLTSKPGEPTLDRNSAASVAVADDLLNAVLFKAWNAQMVSMEMSTEDGSLEPLMLLPLHATEGSISVSAGLPPVVIGDTEGLHAQVGALAIQIITTDGALGQSLNVEADINIDFSLGLSMEMIVIELGEPTVGLQVTDSDWGASNEATTNLISEMLPIDLLMLLIPDIEIEVPSLGTVDKFLPVDTIDVSRDSEGAHTILDITLAE